MAWTTKDEIDWLNALGTHSPLQLKSIPPTRESLASKYLDSAHRRTHWGRMNREKVLVAARVLAGGFDAH